MMRPGTLTLLLLHFAFAHLLWGVSPKRTSEETASLACIMCTALAAQIHYGEWSLCQIDRLDC